MTALGRLAPLAAVLSPVDWVVLVAYLAAMAGLGAWYTRRGRSTARYFLAGRRIPWWAAGLSIFGGGLSAITYMATPAKAFAGDWTWILASVGPVFLIPLVVAFYLPFYRRLNVTTAYEYLEKRFGLAARWAASLYFMAFQFGRMAIVLYLPALALAAATGMEVQTGVIVMGVLATLYTVGGGIEAVIWTDVVQVVVLTGGAVVAVGVAAGEVGGIGAVIEQAASAGKFDVDLSTDPTTAGAWVLLVGSFFAGLGPNTADQSVVQRYLTTPSEKSAARAAWTSALMGLPAAVLFFFLGTCLWAFYARAGQVLPEKLPNDAVLPYFVVTQLPAGLSGLVIAGIFAAAMSSVDSSMNAIATAATTDYYRRCRPATTDKEALWFARGVTAAAGGLATLLAVLLAAAGVKAALDLFFQVLGLFGGSLAGLFVLGIFTRRTSQAGALAGALVSSAVLGYLKYNPSVPFLGRPALPDSLVHPMLFGAIGLGVCLAVGYVVSLAVPNRRDSAGTTLYDMPGRQT